MTEGKSFVVDSWAWIEYFDGSPSGEKIKGYVENEKNIVYTSSVTLAEVVSKFLRKHLDPHQAVKGISTLSIILPVDSDIATFAGELHADIRAHVKDFGLADAFVFAAARKKGAKILTGDPHFKGFKEAIFFT